METTHTYQTPKSIPQVPALFSAYINSNFRNAFIWGIHTEVDASGQFVYKVELSEASNLYHLKFNLGGEIISRKEEAMGL
jgi:hypothetical protein